MTSNTVTNTNFWADPQAVTPPTNIKKIKLISDDTDNPTNGIIGFYPANSVGDDIEVYPDESRGTKSHTFHTLRQQAEKDTEEPYMALSDFIAPKESGVKDYLGMFVATAGIGLDELTAEYKAANDDYSYIMAEALADRLAEAFAGRRLEHRLRLRGGRPAAAVGHLHRQRLAHLAAQGDVDESAAGGGVGEGGLELPL